MEKKQLIDMSSWSRQSHFAFFSQFSDPYFGIDANVDVTPARQYCQDNQLSFFLLVHFASTKVVNSLAPFRYRIENEQVAEYEQVHTTTVLMRENQSFMYAFMPYTTSFSQFCETAAAQQEIANNSTDIGLNEQTGLANTIHYSMIPWINFTGLKHARNYPVTHSNPQISFGKATDNGQGRLLMPVSVSAHHGLMDGYHVGQYLAAFEEALANPQILIE